MEKKQNTKYKPRHKFKPKPQTSIYKKYKKELELIKQHINNEYFYKFIFNWGTKRKEKFYKLNSQISIYECIFLHYLVSSLDKKSNKNVNILEIGLAHGTSGMIINNALNKFTKIPKNKLTYTVIDPNQKTQWKGIGLYNLKKLNTDENIEKKFIFDYSTPVMKSLIQEKKRYNLIFVDGAHDFETVLNDCIYGDKLLKRNGIIVHDDCLHEGVSRAIKKYYDNNPNYKRIQLQENNLNKIENLSKSENEEKDEFINPRTMYAFQKIK